MIPKAGMCAQPGAGVSFASSGSQQLSRPKADQSPAASSVPPNESSAESTLSPRTVSKLMERFSKLETLVASLKEGKVDQSQLKQLREIINKRGELKIKEQRKRSLESDGLMFYCWFQWIHRGT